MYANKNDVLTNIVKALNNDDNPWQIIIEDGIIVGHWKVMDARFIGFSTITDEQKNYRYEVTLDDEGHWKEKDTIQEKEIVFNPFERKISFNSETWNKSITIGFGKNKDTGETGMLKFDFDTERIKEPIRDYLTRCGYTKK